MPTARRVGALMLLAGATWLLGTLIPARAVVASRTTGAPTMSYPTGRLRRDNGRVHGRRRLPDGSGGTVGAQRLGDPCDGGADRVAAVDVFLRTSGPARKAGRAALGASLAFAGVLALGAIGRLAGWGAELAMLLLYDAVVSAVAFALLLELRFGRWVDAAAADLVVGLGDGASASLQTQLRRAMGDPSVVVGYWAPDVGRYVDDAGDHCVPGRGRVVTWWTTTARRWPFSSTTPL